MGVVFHFFFPLAQKGHQVEGRLENGASSTAAAVDTKYYCPVESVPRSIPSLLSAVLFFVF